VTGTEKAALSGADFTTAIAIRKSEILIISAVAGNFGRYHLEITCENKCFGAKSCGLITGEKQENNRADNRTRTGLGLQQNRGRSLMIRSWTIEAHRRSGLLDLVGSGGSAGRSGPPE
jgi:hypothetical protein